MYVMLQRNLILTIGCFKLNRRSTPLLSARELYVLQKVLVGFMLVISSKFFCSLEIGGPHNLPILAGWMGLTTWQQQVSP
jgi:hypothetical protein